MSAISLTLLLAAGVATALGGAALHTAFGLRRQLAALRTQLAEAAAQPAAAGARSGAPDRSGDHGVPSEQLRAAVADALAEQRERELAEARAFWAAQEARDADPESALLDSRGTEYEISTVDAALIDSLLETYEIDDRRDGDGLLAVRPEPEESGTGPEPTAGGRDAADDACGADGEEIDGCPCCEDRSDQGHSGAGAESAELAAARRRHPSQPAFTLRGEPVVPAPRLPSSDDDRTAERIAELAAVRSSLTDVRPGPMGTLDIYVFQDGTTVCMSPGHRETADRLAGALAEGQVPQLLGSCQVSGAYTLTFRCGEENVYVLADRVIATT